MKIRFIIIIFLLLPKISFGQQFYRIKAEFTIKAKLTDGTSQLTMGTVYYDKNAKKLIYKIKFPEPEIWVTKDTILYKIVNDTIKERMKIPAMNEFSIFHLSLNGRLPDYGLQNSYYTISDVEKDEELVITTWLPSQGLRKQFGKILISNLDKRLYGIIFYDPEDVMLSKQFFEEYNNYQGMEFPNKIVQISYVEGQENYQITTFRTILINDIKENDIYNYSLPDL
ncbi:hypothetical protein ACFLSI_06510 [Bacteroidota bacterium]